MDGRALKAVETQRASRGGLGVFRDVLLSCLRALALPYLCGLFDDAFQLLARHLPLPADAVKY
jgi:hypothetical protein